MIAVKLHVPLQPQGGHKLGINFANLVGLAERQIAARERKRKEDCLGIRWEIILVHPNT
jgi:hypothetical protein